MVEAAKHAPRLMVARHLKALLAQVQQSASCNTSHSVEARLSRLLLRARDLHDGAALAQKLLAGRSAR